MAADRNPFGRSLLMQPASRRVGFACGLLAVLWLGILWAVSLP